jgi:hypothetical protein
MRHALVGIAIVASVVGQERPDFSGTWTYDAAHSSKTSPGIRIGLDGTRTEIEINSPPPPALGAEFTAKQDAKTLNLSLSLTQQSVGRRVNGVPVNQSTTGPTVAYTVAYALDGSESNNKMPSTLVGRPETETVSTAAWNANTLVLTINNKVDFTGAAAVVDRHSGNEASDDHDGLHTQALSVDTSPVNRAL